MGQESDQVTGQNGFGQNGLTFTTKTGQAQNDLFSCKFLTRPFETNKFRYKQFLKHKVTKTNFSR